MPEPVVEIPNRPAFRASEVCEIAQIPPYVLKSWEKEFPGLGVAPKPGGPRVYRRGDIEQVLRIKQLLFAEGLTLAGVRRKLEGEPPPVEEPLPEFVTPVNDTVRAKVGAIKRELRSLLELLSRQPDQSVVAASVPEPGEPAAGQDEEQAAGQSGEPVEDLPLLAGTPESVGGEKARRRPRGKHAGRI